MYERYFKRLLDIVISGIALVILLPILLIIVLLVRIKFGSPVLFKQQRPGKNENIFEMYKFRSMTSEKDINGNLLPDEERLPKIGKILRKTSLDELPGLWNVFIGDMSIVGPRPLLVQYLPLYNERQKLRHQIRPGLTGLAQINGRNNLSWYEKFEWDIRYVNEIKFTLDLKIITKTIIYVFRQEGISSSTSVTMEPFRGNDEIRYD